MRLEIDRERIRHGTDDIVAAFREFGSVPARVDDYDELLRRLRAAEENVPGVYREVMAAPIIGFLEDLGKARYSEALSAGSQQSGTLAKMFDIAETVLQRGEMFQERATHAFQEVVCDLYDRFLQRERTAGVQITTDEIIPPMTKWGGPTSGPYTWDLSDIDEFGVGCGIVNLPVAFADRGLFAWVCLGHETTGHALLFYKDDARQELQAAVGAELKAEGFEPLIVDYWSSRLEESASDVCGILHMGPAVGVGLICGFRAQNEVMSDSRRMSGEGTADNPHPATILRGYMAAKTASFLNVSSAADWSALIASETDKDVTDIHLNGELIDTDKARHSAEVVATTIATKPIGALGGRSLRDVRNWNDDDEAVVSEIKELQSELAITTVSEAVCGSHAVSAAIRSVLDRQHVISAAFDNMQNHLQALHKQNPHHTGHVD